jgi:hypothetical protein
VSSLNCKDDIWQLGATTAATTAYAEDRAALLRASMAVQAAVAADGVLVASSDSEESSDSTDSVDSKKDDEERYS